MEKTSVIDLLRAANRDDMVSKPLEVEIKRLSAVFGKPFVMALKPVSYAKWSKLVNSNADYRSELIAAAWADGRSIGNDVLDKFGAVNAPELIRSILNAGEIAKLAAKVEQISGFGNSVEELKKK